MIEISQNLLLNQGLMKVMKIIRIMENRRKNHECLAGSSLDCKKAAKEF